ncbi:cation-dependent mannose-6-phosphate receptor [Paramisgurnus dabryanus]|uniref:cation-dependent mannose-6-phosphate receptor n=1 Tax=Paramisgurnus dabryanus TaxID=90735 RepID=UPI0031F366DC
MLLTMRIITPLFLLLGGVRGKDNVENCKLILGSDSEKKVLRLLEPLTEQNFTLRVEDGKEVKEKYTYIFRVCGDVAGMPYAGLVQLKDDGTKVRIGNYDQTRVIGGSDWVLLIYEGGEKYDTHCSQGARKAMIMISCSKSTKGDFSEVLEVRDMPQDCYYLFELDTSAVCPVIPSKLSAGSIFLIVVFCCLAAYITGGFVYQRLVVGAKGVEQFPNYAFWSEIGNLSADGCDFVCRSRGNREEPPTYRGVATEPLEDERDERDDHLLPM